jgi:hypothetical protein
VSCIPAVMGHPVIWYSRHPTDEEIRIRRRGPRSGSMHADLSLVLNAEKSVANIPKGACPTGGCHLQDREVDDASCTMQSPFCDVVAVVAEATMTVEVERRFGIMKDRPCRGSRLLLPARASPPNLDLNINTSTSAARRLSLASLEPADTIRAATRRCYEQPNSSRWAPCASADQR